MVKNKNFPLSASTTSIKDLSIKRSSGRQPKVSLKVVVTYSNFLLKRMYNGSAKQVSAGNAPCNIKGQKVFGNYYSRFPQNKSILHVVPWSSY